MRNNIFLVIITVILTASIGPLVQNHLYPTSKKLSITELHPDLRTDTIPFEDVNLKILKNYTQKIIFKNDGPSAIENLKIAFEVPKEIVLIDNIKIETIPAIDIEVITIIKDSTNGKSYRWRIDLLNRNKAISFTFNYRIQLPNSIENATISPTASAKDLTLVYTGRPQQEKNPYKIAFIISVLVILFFILLILFILKFIIWFMGELGKGLSSR